MTLLASNFSCSSSSYYDIGGDWNPEALGVSNDIEEDSPSRGLSLYESFESLSPDGSKLLRYQGLSLHVMNPDGNGEKVLVSHDGGSWALNVVWSPDSSRVAYRKWWPSGARSESYGQLTVPK
jgi:hypothetical protein